MRSTHWPYNGMVGDIRCEVLDAEGHLHHRRVGGHEAKRLGLPVLVRDAVAVHSAHRGVGPWCAEVGVVPVRGRHVLVVLCVEQLVAVDTEVPLGCEEAEAKRRRSGGEAERAREGVSARTDDIAQASRGLGSNKRSDAACVVRVGHNVSSGDVGDV